MRLLVPLIGLLFLGLASGCATYQLGTSNKLSFHTLYISPVGDKARLPQAVAVFTTQLREAFIRDGRVSVVNSPDEADATLTVALDHYSRDITSSRPDDTGLARKFNLNLTAICALHDNHTGKVLFEKRQITAEQQVFTTTSPQQLDSNQTQAEYQALPLLASTLADKTLHATLDVW